MLLIGAQNLLIPPAWLEFVPIRIKMTLEHSTPYDRQFIEEVTVAHRGKNQANEILIPINDFRHGLKILDQDDSLLSYYSVGTIRERIAEYSSQIRNRIEMRLDSGYLL